jgi:formamidopyrimidine-DNA glycosylase
VPALSPKDVENLHFQLRNICETAVNVNADHKKFPEDWLFRWRWSKGKKQERGSKKHQPDEGSEEDADEDLKPRNKDFLALVGIP